MEIKHFGKAQGKSVMLLHGNLMCWRQFEDLIPLLEKDYSVYAVSFDGFDGSGITTYTTAQAQADKLEDYIRAELDGHLDMLFAELRKRYDYIIVDTAPVAMVSDTFLHDRISDMTLFVSRANYTPREMIDFINQITEQKRLKHIACVFNGVKNAKAGYGYGYGYGYGNTKK